MARMRVRGTQLSRRKVTVPALMMKQAGDSLVTRIVDRTRRGIGEDGRRFPPYADGSGPVTLYKTGRMLHALRTIFYNNRLFRIGFTDAEAEEIAGYHIRGTRKMPRRPFMTPAKSWVKDLVSLVAAKLKLSR